MSAGLGRLEKGVPMARITNVGTTNTGGNFGFDTTTEHVSAALRSLGYFPIVKRTVTDRAGDAWRVATVLGPHDGTLKIVLEGY